MVLALRKERIRGGELEVYPPRKLHDEHMRLSEKLSDVYSREGDLRSDHRNISGREDDLRRDHKNIASRADTLRGEHRTIYDNQNKSLSNQVALGDGHHTISSRLDSLETRIYDMERKVDYIYRHIPGAPGKAPPTRPPTRPPTKAPPYKPPVERPPHRPPVWGPPTKPRPK